MKYHDPEKHGRLSHMTQQAESNVRRYTQTAFDRMYHKLGNHGFTRTDMYTWEYKREGRFIRVTVTNESYVEVNFNGERKIYQSPFGIMEGLDEFHG